MRAVWIVALRELRDKTRLFLFAAGLAVMPFAATLLPGTQGRAADTISLLAGVLATALGAGLGLVFGTSVSRDLVERRLSFWFTKPVSAAAIWFGRSAAALFVSFACALIIAVPAMIATRSSWGMRDPASGSIGLLVVIAPYLIGHAVSTMIRSRSALLALDFVFFAVSAAVAYLIARPLLQIGVGVSPILPALIVGVLAVLALAPVWQLANGRSDIRRSHAALMRFLWPGIAIVLLLGGGAVAWMLHVSVQDVDIEFLEQAQRGPLVVVSGKARRRFEYEASFLFDRDTAAVTRINAPLWWGSRLSGDGSVAAWLEPVGVPFAPRALELHTNRGATGIEMPFSANFVLSDDGSRVAVTNGTLLAVHEIATGKLLASGAGLDGRSRQQIFFLTRDIVRVIEHEPRTETATALRIFELDVRARKTQKLSERLVAAQPNAASVSGDGSRMFIRGANVILDGRTGATVATLVIPESVNSGMLYDGRVAAATREAGVPHLRIFAPDGTPLHDIAFPAHRGIWIGAETEEGKLILAATDRRTVVVDLATGTVERTLILRGAVPGWGGDAHLPRFAAGQELVAVDAKERLVVWSLARPDVRPLLR